MNAYEFALRARPWRSTRRAVFNLAKGLCRCCGTPTALTEGHVHHPQYDGFRPPHDYSPGELHWLCRYCHAVAHDPLPPNPEQLSLFAPGALDALMVKPAANDDRFT